MTQPYGSPGGQPPYPGPPAAVPRPWYKKKRFLIPGGLLGLTLFAGAFSDPVTDETLGQAAPTVTVTRR